MSYRNGFGARIYFYFSNIAGDILSANFSITDVLITETKKVFNIGIRTLIYYKIKSKPLVSHSVIFIFISQDFGFLFIYCCSIMKGIICSSILRFCSIGK